MARRLRLVLIATVILLYVVSVPWYRGAGESPELWWGLPDWVAVAVACYVAIAVLNADRELDAVHAPKDVRVDGLLDASSQLAHVGGPAANESVEVDLALGRGRAAL